MEEHRNVNTGLAEERIARIVRHINREFQRCLERRLFSHGINFGFWDYLRVLWKEDGISQRTLSDRVGLTGPTTHSVIRRMETAGLIELRPIVKGKPRRAVFLSDHGRQLESTLKPVAEEVNNLAVGDITAEEAAQLRRLLMRLHDNLLADG